MLKKKFAIILLVLITAIALILPVVRAAETDSATTSEVEPISIDSEETTENQDATVPAEQNFKQGDVYLSGEDVTIDYVVDGNVFVMAKNVTINSQIGGDAFILADTVTVGEQGYIFSNLFAVANSVNVQGVVYDLYSASKELTITGYIYRDIKVGTNSLNLYGTVGRNAFVSCDSIKFSQESTDENETVTTTSQGIINGNLEYSSKNEISIPEGSVTGEVKYTQINATSMTNIQSYLISLGTIIATAILVWLVCLWLAPKFVKKVDLVDKKKILPEIGLGIISPIILMVVSIVLIILGITSSFGLLLLAITFILMGLSTSVFIIAINNLVCNKLKIQKTIGNFGMLIVSSAILWLIGLIPYVGVIVGIIAIIIGLGILVYHLVRKEKTNKDEKVQEAK